MITLASVEINKKTKKYIKEALKSGFIGQGSFINSFQESMRSYFGVKYAFYVANGTLADAVSLSVLKQLNPDRDEVIVPALTFIAQINAVIMAGLKPVYVDVGDRFNIDVNQIEEKINEKTLAIMPVHLLGIPADMIAIKQLAKKHHLFIVEDCCEAFGSKCYNKFVGTWGDIGAFSFFISHTITTGEGGLIITDNDQLAEVIASVMNHGRKSQKPLEKFEFPYFGFNAKGTNLGAAIGLSLVPKIDEIIKKRRESVYYLNKMRHNFSFRDYEPDFISPHCYPIQANSRLERDKKIEELDQAGIECRTLYNSIPNNTYLKQEGKIFEKALAYSENWYFVPIHHLLKRKDLDYILSKI